MVISEGADVWGMGANALHSVIVRRQAAQQRDYKASNRSLNMAKRNRSRRIHTPAFNRGRQKRSMHVTDGLNSAELPHYDLFCVGSVRVKAVQATNWTKLNWVSTSSVHSGNVNDSATVVQFKSIPV